MKGINSKLIHGDIENTNAQQNFRSLKTPIYETASYDFETAEDVENAFRGKIAQFAYSRTANPTVAELQNRLKYWTEAQAVLCTSSGMAAIANTMFTLCKKGDNILASKYLFGNTYSFFKETFSEFGVETRFIDFENLDEVKQNIDENTRCVFLEMVTNPQLIIFDMTAIGAICKEKNIVFVLDNTALTPYLFSTQPHGVDIEIISTSKFISGGATSIGGAIVMYPSTKYRAVPKLQKDIEKYSDEGFYKRLFREVFRNMGSCLAPNNAYLQLLGLETLSLRIDKVCENATAVAAFLQSLPQVKNVEYNNLPTSPYYAKAQDFCNGKVGALINLQLENQAKCYDFMNRLKMIRRGTNFCDNKSMIIHPASTIFCDNSPEECLDLKIYDDALRLSIGIEDLEDLKADILQAIQ